MFRGLEMHSVPQRGPTMVSGERLNAGRCTGVVTCEAQSWVLVNQAFCRLSPNPM
jgi:hypothetical protein